ncbi:hypothetical protein BD779DRAFT_1179022 [Infundibulicybe gibba]|nr:hypothetical protein BD779DRAFT_1179022 [Infundibulicybe gibba]
MLCGNRFPLPGSPSTCELDTIIVPLPSFFLIFVLLFWFIRRSGKPGAAFFIPRKWTHIVYLFLVGAACAMSILELARLVAEDLGVGLLPVTTIALIFVWVMLYRERGGRTRGVLTILMAYWLLLGIVVALKSTRLHELEILNPNTAKTSNYPSSDQLLDNAVMVRTFVDSSSFT